MIWKKLFYLLIVFLLFNAGCNAISDTADSVGDFISPTFETKDPGNTGLIIDFFERDSIKLKADGMDTVTVSAQIHVDADTDKVTFKTNAGFFKNVVDSAREVTVRAEMVSSSDTIKLAQVVFVAGTVARAGILSASISGFEKTKDFMLVRAWPERIVGETSAGFVDTAGEKRAVITANLFRGNGAVSQGTEVKFTAFQITGSDTTVVGRFTGLGIGKSDDRGRASITFSADRGKAVVGQDIFINMETQNDLGESICDQISIGVR